MLRLYIKTSFTHVSYFVSWVFKCHLSSSCLQTKLRALSTHFMSELQIWVRPAAELWIPPQMEMKQSVKPFKWTRLVSRDNRSPVNPLRPQRPGPVQRTWLVSQDLFESKWGVTVTGTGSEKPLCSWGASIRGEAAGQRIYCFWIYAHGFKLKIRNVFVRRRNK